MKIHTLFTCTALMAAMCACGSDNDEPQDLFDVASAPSVSYVTDASATGKIYDGAIYRVTYNESKKTAVVNIDGLRWAELSAPANFVLTDVPWKYDPSDKSRVISLDRVTPDGADHPVFTDFEIVYYPENDAFEEPASGMAVSFEVDGVYELTNVARRTLFAGTTETVNAAAPGSPAFVSTVTTYAVTLNADNTKADLEIINASFAAEMPKLNLKFEDLDVTFDEEGFALASARFIPKFNGAPMPSFEVTNLWLEAELDGRSELKFHCMTFDVDAVFYGSYSPAE